MPTYELKCRECGKASEVFLLRTIRDEDKVCPECGSEDVKQGVGGGFFSMGDSASTSAGASCQTGGCSPQKRSAFG